MQLNCAIADPQMTEFFVIQRSTGQFSLGGFTDTKQNINAYGGVSVAGGKDLDQTPEADRVTGAMKFWMQKEIFVTHETPTAGVSDIIIWKGHHYRIASVLPYPNRGYWSAIGFRMEGQ
jgi:hypothetical protein